MIRIPKGSMPLTDVELEERIQQRINNYWPQWKRERSFRKNDGEFNDFMVEWENAFDEAKENNIFNNQLEKYKKAMDRLAVPDSLKLHNNREEKEQAQAVVDATPQAVQDFEG